MSSMPKEATKTRKPGAVEREAVRELVKAARARGEDLTGPEGLLKTITATVLEAALEEEMTEHLVHEKHCAPAGGAVNIRNGTRPKTVLTDAAGEVTIEVPRDRAGTFEPVIVKNRQRRLTDVPTETTSPPSPNRGTPPPSPLDHRIDGAGLVDLDTGLIQDVPLPPG